MSEARVGLVIEDDQDIRELVRVVLSQAGFDVHVASTGSAGVNSARELNPDVITLDLGLPDIDGFEVARQIRKTSDAYIIMLTARAEELDTLMGLEAGGDDYLTKPFRPRELRARVEAMMRRPRSSSDAKHAPEAADPEMTHNGLAVSAGSRTAVLNGSELKLTRTEFDLLVALLETGRIVRTKADLARRLRNEPYDVGSYVSDADERAVEVHMGNLRKKLGDSIQSPRWLETVRGVGYRLAPAVHNN
ncbi:response regulator transcription factor [Paenarthrobacter ureafaciens]|jgi:DNA-binding response OmpR family regulator|uniref:response regulator transcription factor n=1 Tax=Paenarthrobacter TaxID=1742992 RepID=UPI002230DC60|nr:response regulator transcription factor [Paenarthrobacter sp. PAE-2]MCW3766777.1 response regulator transcription factor [Paenarthrobacter sp. PAE-2]